LGLQVKSKDGFSNNFPQFPCKNSVICGKSVLRTANYFWIIAS